MKIQVTQSNIDLGHLSTPGSCPLARAILDSIPDVWDVKAEHDEVSWKTGSAGFGALTRYICDHDARGWIEAFDSGIDVGPVTVNLENYQISTTY